MRLTPGEVSKHEAFMSTLKVIATGCVHASHEFQQKTGRTVFTSVIDNNRF
jgi:hypothetical protein